jgi:hypothetical protein
LSNAWIILIFYKLREIERPKFKVISHAINTCETPSIARHPVGRMGTPEEIAEAVV